jgi:hypothetical protein
MNRGLTDDAERQLRIELERWTSRMARDVIAPQVPPGRGFAFVAFDFGDGGNLAYCSNADRHDMLHALRDLLGRWEREIGVPIENRHRSLFDAALALYMALDISATTEDDSADEDAMAAVVGATHDALGKVLAALMATSDGKAAVRRG